LRGLLLRGGRRKGVRGDEKRRVREKERVGRGGKGRGG